MIEASQAADNLIHYGPASYIALDALHTPRLLFKLIFSVAESAFLSFEQNATLVLLYELFACTCRCEVRSFSAFDCGLKIALLSSISFVKDVFGVTIQFLLLDDRFEVSAIVTIINRVVDASFSFLLTLPVLYLSVRVGHSAVKSVRFQQQNSSAGASSVLAHPLLRIVVSVALVQIITFVYYLIKVVAFIPKHELREEEWKEEGAIKWWKEAFWSISTPHCVMPQWFSLLGIVLMFLSRSKIPMPECGLNLCGTSQPAASGENGNPRHA